MSTLDQRLYAWLLECDERAFERAFAGYFSIAFPCVVRHLARLSRWDVAELEEVAQDALLRFFDKVGRERREAADQARRTLADIQPLPLGSLHTREVTGWTGDVRDFIADSMGFRPREAGAQFKTLIRELAARIPVLQGSGYDLFGAVQVGLKPAGSVAAGAADGEEAARRRFAEDLLREAAADAGRASALEASLPGVLGFVEGTLSVIRVVPRLQVPTNSYLFEITTSRYLDECKRRGRRKRGGAGSDPDADAWTGIALEGGQAVPAADPTLDYEQREWFEKFSAYLRAPVEAAMQACARAEASGRGAAERRRAESLSAKYSRMMAVLEAIGEGFTQESTAERLGLTRNQVKYILEQVQASYAAFTARSAGVLLFHAL